MLTSDIENFPGYPEGIGGQEMMMQLREQAERFGLEVQDRNVENVVVDVETFPAVELELVGRCKHRKAASATVQGTVQAELLTVRDIAENNLEVLVQPLLTLNPMRNELTETASR